MKMHNSLPTKMRVKFYDRRNKREVYNTDLMPINLVETRVLADCEDYRGDISAETFKDRGYSAFPSDKKVASLGYKSKHCPEHQNWDTYCNLEDLVFLDVEEYNDLDIDRLDEKLDETEGLMFRYQSVPGARGMRHQHRVEIWHQTKEGNLCCVGSGRGASPTEALYDAELDEGNEHIIDELDGDQEDLLRD